MKQIFLLWEEKLFGDFRSVHRLKSIVLVSLVIIILSIYVLNFPVRNEDGFKQLSFGKYLHSFNKIPHHSVFTHFPVKDFVTGDAHDWLGSLFLYETLSLFGFAGLHVMKFLYIIPFLFLLLRLSNYNFSLYWFASSLMMVFVLSGKLYVRSAGIAVPLCGILLLCLILSRDFNHSMFVYFIPPLLVIWGNIHASFLFGFVFIVVYFLGRFIDYLRPRFSISLNKLTRLLFVVIVSLVGITFVKPFPDYELIHRLNSLFNHTDRIVVEKVSDDESNFSTPQYIKSITHDVVVKERPFVSSEFEYSLSLINLPVENLRYVKILRFTFLFMIPLITIAFLIVGQRLRLSSLLPVLFVTWLGIGVVRVSPYVVACSLPITLSELRSRQFLTGDLKPVVLIPRIMVSVLVPICVVVLLVFQVLSTINRLPKSFTAFLPFRPKISLSLGKSHELRTSFPDKLLDQHGELRIHTAPTAVGSYLLWEWWPRKKVSLYSKTTAYRETFLQKYFSGRPINWIFDKYDLSGAAVGVNQKKNYEKIFSTLPEWRLIHVSKPYGWMYFYCEICEN